MVASGEESQYSESGTSRCQQIKEKSRWHRGETKKRQYRRSCRMTAIVDGVAIKHGKRKRWSPEKVEAKTAAWEEGQKKKWNKGACECGGTEGKHAFESAKKTIESKERAGLNAKLQQYVDGAGHKEDSDCIRQALQKNERIESRICKNAKPSLSGKNIDQAMEVNPMEGKSKALESGTSPPNECEEIFKRDKEAFEREKEIGRTLREKKEKQRKNSGKARETSEGEVNDSKAGKGKPPPKPRSPAQNEAEPGPSEAGRPTLKGKKRHQKRARGRLTRKPRSDSGELRTRGSTEGKVLTPKDFSKPRMRLMIWIKISPMQPESGRKDLSKK
ncbi:hypothetical protein JTB14_028619 [Gonioctena quinquepunctata]|nr:hypothetical protein JTB14_028619 [Gonioctena quinquepunctata]